MFFLLLQITPYFIDYELVKAAPNKDMALLTEMLNSMIYIEIIGVIIWSSLCALFYKSRWQATPGKKIMGMKVLRSSGAALTFWEGFQRTAALPLFLLMLQIWERKEIYSKLLEIKASPDSYKTIEEVFLFISSSQIVAYSDLAVMILGSMWLFLAAFTREKTAFHDILFDTRVIYDKK
jgi:uncharacterized RDD family membrane protein YckC